MDSLKRRNPPKTPKTAKFDAEIRRSPSRGARKTESFPARAAVVDLFGLEQQPKRTNDKPEAAALSEVLKALKAHPAVAWCERQNSGAARIGNRFVRFGWPVASRPRYGRTRPATPVLPWTSWRIKS